MGLLEVLSCDYLGLNFKVKFSRDLIENVKYRYAQKIKFQNQSIFELNLASYDSKTISIEKFSKQEVISCMISLSVHLVPIILTEHVSMMTEQIQTIKNWTKCRMRTLLLVKYRDEPFAKTCIQYPFVATANENNKIRLLST